MRRLLATVIALVVTGCAQAPQGTTRYPSNREIAHAHRETASAQSTQSANGGEGTLSAFHNCLGARLISTAMEADPRVPIESDISGAWVQNPEIIGPTDAFALIQVGNEITGLGYESSCIGLRATKIKGTRDGRALRLQFTYCDGGPTRTVRYEIMDYHGVIALAHDWREDHGEYTNPAANLEKWAIEKSQPSLVPANKRAELNRILEKQNAKPKT